MLFYLFILRTSMQALKFDPLEIKVVSENAKKNVTKERTSIQALKFDPLEIKVSSENAKKIVRKGRVKKSLEGTSKEEKTLFFGPFCWAFILAVRKSYSQNVHFLKNPSTDNDTLYFVIYFFLNSILLFYFVLFLFLFL